MNELIIDGQYNSALVALSISLAIFASYTALDLAGRTAQASGYIRIGWLSGGAIAMGLGIWAMHYIGMLAFRLPVPVYYDVAIVLFSLFAAIASSAVALIVVSRKTLSQGYLGLGSIAMGGGIVLMHYSGMQAMQLAASAHYNYWIVSLSVAVAIAVSYVGLYLAFHLRDARGNPTWLRVAAAVVMGLAIASMHYTGMAAVCFHGMAGSGVRLQGPKGVAISPLGITGIAALSFAVLALSLLGAMSDRRFARQSEIFASEQERWRLLMSSSQEGLFDANLKTGQLFCSPRWLAILGYAPGELDQSHGIWEDRLHPDDRQSVLEKVAAYLKSGHGTSELEYRLRHRDMSYRWILARTQAVWDAQGNAIRLVGSHSDITDRKEAAAQLKTVQARFIAFMDNNPSIAYIKDADGRMVYTNKTFERTWHLKPGEWIGRFGREIWPSELAEKIVETDQEVLATGVPAQFTKTLKTPDGVTRQFLTNHFCFADASGQKVIGVVSVDITDRARSEGNLRASEARYRELFEHNPVASWIYSTDDLRILDVNDAAIEHYGWSRVEFLEMSVSSISLPGETQRIETELRDCRTSLVRTSPLQHRRKTRSNIWVELAVREIEVAGRPARLVMANDITARIEAESELRKARDQMENLVVQRTAELQTSEARWRGLVEALPQFVWTTDNDGNCTYISSQWADFSGVPEKDLLGLGWLKSIHEADHAEATAIWKTARETETPYQMEYRIRATDGSYRWFVSRGIPMRDFRTGLLTHWLGTSTDIDDQKRSEERLEKAVSERTLALAEARDKAECAAQAKSSFLAAMSHEIRTPMNGVIGMTGMMLDTQLTSEQHCYLDIIRSSGQALLAIINDVLDFSKIEASKVELESIEFDLQSVFEESVELVAVSAAQKGLHLELNIGDDVPFTILGDPGRLRQVLLNLLSNGIKFTEDGSVSVSVTREALSGPVIALRIAVRDTGIGMTEAQQAGLFQAFTQADRSTTRRFGGTGLGLTIAKRLVELMGGTIGVSSEPGQGTTFWLNICASPGLMTQQLSLKGRRILLLGNEGSASMALVKRHLRRAEAEVFSSQDRVELADCVVIADSDAIQCLAQLPAVASSRRAVLVMGSPSDIQAHGPLTDIPLTFCPKPVRCVTLLQATHAALLGAKPAQPAGKPGDLFSVMKNSEILVVEDNRVNQLIARQILGKLGCHVEVAENGKEACAALQRRSFDLVLMDCQMPVMDGFEATRTIRAAETGKRRTPIIALTAGVLREERDQCYAAGMDDFLSKPIDRSLLECTLTKWLVRPMAA